MSVDLVTHINVKRGLNSNPSRAAGRPYVGRSHVVQCPSSFGKCSRFSGPDLLAEISSSSSKETQTSSTEPESRVMRPSGMVLAASLVVGAFSEKGPCTAVLSLFRSLPLIPVQIVGLFSSREIPLSLPFCLFAGRQLPSVRPLRRGERRDAFSQGVRGSQQRKMRFSKRRAKQPRRDVSGQQPESGGKTSSLALTLSLFFSLLKRRHIYRKAMPYS